MRFFPIALSLALVAACTTPDKSNVVPQSLTVSTSSTTDGVRYWASSPLTDLGRKRTVTVTTPAGNVAYLVTNTSSTSSYTAKLDGVGGDVAAPRSARAALNAPERMGVKGPLRLSLGDVPSAPDLPTGRPAARGVATPPSFSISNPPAVGNTFTFVDALWTGLTPGSTNQHPSTLRSQRSIGSSPNKHTVNVWVADDCWSTDGTTNAMSNPGGSAWNPPSHLVTQAMVDALAARFLTDGVNDIYAWDTDIFGQEWASAGSPLYTYQGRQYEMIDSEGNIHIFVCNLNPGGTDNGVLEGYFHSLNNFPASGPDAQTGSNGLILFALDADTLANPSNTIDDSDMDWSINDFWPSEALSTLAHEFQHMIQFYQKQVLHNVSLQTATWINEMCSMLAEDVVSQKLQVKGPRGVLGSDFSAGSAGNTDGRLPFYSYWHDVAALTAWYSGANVLISYSNAYAFGAWLLRNYGGPALLRDIVQSKDTTTQAVVDAVNNHGGNGASFASLVRDWGIATYLGSSESAGFAYASPEVDQSFSWTLGDQYSVGSVNLYNYTYQWAASAGNPEGSYDGVWIDDRGFTSGDVVAAGATSIHVIGSQPSRTVTLTLPPNTALTVVVGPVPTASP